MTTENKGHVELFVIRAEINEDEVKLMLLCKFLVECLECHKVLDVLVLVRALQFHCKLAELRATWKQSQPSLAFLFSSATLANPRTLFVVGGGALIAYPARAALAGAFVGLFLLFAA